MNRRAFLRGMAAGATLLGVGAATAQLPRALPFRPDAGRPTILGQDDGTLFTHNVASGDPTASGAIIWTRLNPEGLQADQPLWFEVASDDAFENVVLRGKLDAALVKEDFDWTARTDLDGHLAPFTQYAFRFVHGGIASPTGHLKTLPRKDQAIDRVRFATYSCTNFPEGYFGGYASALEKDVDYVLHLGDYIYEYNTPSGFADRNVPLPSGESRMVSLEDLYFVYQTYRADPDLQKLHQERTWMHIMDDHEIANNRYYDYETERYHGDDGFPIDDDAEATNQFFFDGLKAYFAWMPMRVHYRPNERDPFEAWTPYRFFQVGSLVDLAMIDGRWYRSPQAPLPGEESTDLTETNQSTATMLGRTQLAWLNDKLARSKATWRLLGNQTLFVPLGGMIPYAEVYVNTDAWDGYRGERDQVAATLGIAGNGKNNVIITGDMHAFSAAYVSTEYGIPNELPPLHERVGVEFMIGGLTSSGLGAIVDGSTGLPLRAVPGFDDVVETAIIAGNPHFRHFNWQRNGYGILEFTSERMQVTLYEIDRTIAGFDHEVVLRKYEVPSGSNELIEVEANSIRPGALQIRTEAKPTTKLSGRVVKRLGAL